jgi:hypothetical protein
MMEALFVLVSLIKYGLKNRITAAVENLALRQQLAIQQSDARAAFSHPHCR